MNLIQTYQDKKIVESFDKEREEFYYQKYKTKVESDFLFRAMRNRPHSLQFPKENGESNTPVWLSRLKILDVGCGTGRMLGTCLEESGGCTKYYGIDTSKEMIKILKEKIKFIGYNKKEAITRIGNATKLPFKDETFDITFSYHLLWHLPKKYQEKIIKEMFRVTKKDGFIIFDILNEKFIWDKIKGYFGIKKTKGVYKNDIFLEDVFDVEKFNDAILPDNKYKFFKIINKCRKVLPRNFFHMIYFKIQK